MTLSRNRILATTSTSLRAFALASTALTVSPLVLPQLGLTTAFQAEAQSFAFNTVRVEGNGRVATDTVLSYAGIARGQTVSGAELNDAYQSVVASGLFETVEFTPQGSTLVIRVSEYPTVNAISIEGNARMKDDDLLPILGTQVRRVYSPTQLENDAAAIAEVYEVKGRLAATVTPRIIRRDQNRVDVVFEVTEGKVVEVERLSFVGNRSFSDGRLRRVLETKQAGFLRAIIQRDTFSPARLDFDKQVLTDFYTSRGYVDFQILDVNAEFTRDRSAYFLTFSLQEGQSFDFGNVTVSSEIAGVDASAYADVINVRAGQTYSPVAIETVISRMEAVAEREGVDFLNIEPRVTRNDRAQTLDVDFVLTRGPRVFVERIDVQGNVTTLDRVVRQQFDTVEGDPFNPREIRKAASRIRALGFFSDASVNAREGSSPDQVVVNVDVTEQPTGSFSIGGNYSISDGFNLVASYSERNFLGRGQTLSFDLTTQLDDGSLSFNFLEPRFLGRNVGFGLNAYYRNVNYSYADFGVDTYGFSPELTFPLSENARLAVNYEISRDEVTLDSDGTVPAYIQKDIDQGMVTESTVGYALSYDNRRSGLNPDAGIVLRFGQDYSGAGGDVEFLKTNATAAAETKVFNGDVTLRAILEGGHVESFDENGTRVTDRYMNSPSMIRGFEPGGIGPRAQDGTPLGGNSYAVLRLESEFPLGLPEEYGISGGLFVDYGSVWGLDDFGDMSTIDGLDFTPRGVVGATIFWTTPLGPLRFNFTHAFQKEDYDEEQTFDLTISTSF
ncbi:Outer membrane protein assembly factor BamA precursor [Aquimixticola soesokkakensis]|uniref:Outer membrane protein assembly factor BamA n=1 Tax=Aquimixticola soesokkakensis TaxID=1519096 RepID=A0A1Y5SKF2_9RHOB|nr:outer membrane protein assembly factor BamA [Aquimixticola soesokkakensis]SLN39897.1 Outer membrane protein assembly factor BamA precursor [Aquimixticola soesokkakensis]